MERDKNDTESIFNREAEEIAGMLKTSVLDPLDETAGVLGNVWTDDEAAKVFLTRLAAHRENIRAAHRQLEIAAQEFLGMK